MEVDSLHWPLGAATEALENCVMNDKEEFNINLGVEDDSPEFESWLKPRSRKGRGYGRGSGGACNPIPACRNENDDQMPTTCLE